MPDLTSPSHSVTPTPTELIARAADAAREQKFCELMLDYLHTAGGTPTLATGEAVSDDELATLTVAEVADLLGRHVSTIRRMRDRGELPATKHDKNRFRKSTVKRFLGGRPSS